MTQKTCMDCHYVVRTRTMNGLDWNFCIHPDHKGGMLPFPRCDDFVEKDDDETEIFEVVRR